MLQAVLWQSGKGCKEGQGALIIFPQLFISLQTPHLAIFRTDSHMIPKQSKAKQTRRLEGGREEPPEVYTGKQHTEQLEMPHLGFLEDQVITWGENQRCSLGLSLHE